MQDLKKVPDALASAIDPLASNTTLKDKLDQVSSSHDQLKSMYDSTRDDVEQWKQDHREIKDALKSKDQELNSWKSEGQGLSVRISDLERASREMQDMRMLENTERSVITSNLESSIAQLEEQLSSVQGLLSQEQKDRLDALEEFEREQADLRTRLDSTIKLLSELSQNHQKLTKEMTAILSKLSQEKPQPVSLWTNTSKVSESMF